MSDARSATHAMEDLEGHIAPIIYLSDISSLLSWDQQVIMPPAGTPARANQRATISRVIYDRLTDDAVGSLLDELDSASLEGDDAAIVREVRRQYERQVRVPGELVETIKRTTAEAHPVWERARQTDDFDRFAPKLEEIIELKREYAAHIDPDRPPYEVLFEDYEPYLSLDVADSILASLRDGLVPLIERIQTAEPGLALDAFDDVADVEQQEAASRAILDVLAFDWDRGRLDTSTHPFSSGTQFDARITTRYDESDLLSGLMATIHEFGHAQYGLGLSQDAYGTPLGEDRGLTVHESQSRFWENHVGRSEAFWTFALPLLREHIPWLDAVSKRDAYEAANQVYSDNLIRVEADELTYHLHIVIRYEIERALIAGELDVEDVPTVWNDTYEDYLGVRPETDTEGCLQDIHWSSGSIGYFPTYSLGSVLAAQLHAAVERDIGAPEPNIRAGEFEPIADWHTTNIHAHGQRYTTPDLIKHATGETFSADAFLSYVEEKYTALYGL